MNRLITVTGNNLLQPICEKPKFGREFWIKLLIRLSLLLLTLDFLYKIFFGITYQNRQECLLYESLPRWAFLFYEYFIELLLIIIAGLFMAALVEKYFNKIHKFIPRNSLTAFLYASVLPVCSCSAIPMIKSLNSKIPFRVLITFIVAAPLLNPYIISISFVVLGWQYTIIRIICSFILALLTGYIVELFYNKINRFQPNILNGCVGHNCCSSKNHDIYQMTFTMLKKIFLFMIIAGVLSLTIELLSPEKILRHWEPSGSLIEFMIFILVGVPIYFCNGADVLFLKPLIEFAGLPLSSAMAFSLTSTSVCVSSLFLLVKYIGRKLTTVLLLSIVAVTLLLSLLIQVFISYV